MVIPVYLTLMGMVFMLGEMGVKALGLAVSDRLGSFIAGGRSPNTALTVLKEKLFLMTEENRMTWTDDLSTSGFTDDVSIDQQATWRKDSDFDGAWLHLAAATVANRYALPPWTRGWLQYPHAVFDSTTGQSHEGGVLEDLLKDGSLGRALMYSKDWDSARTRIYNYYTLMRTEEGRRGYRSWDGGKLVSDGAYLPVTTSKWKTKVADEPAPYDSIWGKDGAEALDSNPSSGANSPPKNPGRQSDHCRFELFVTWSQ